MANRNPLRPRFWSPFAASSLLGLLCVPAFVGCAGRAVDLGSNGKLRSNGGAVYSSAIPANSSDSGAPAPGPFRVVDAETETCLGYGINMTFGVHSGRLYWLSLPEEAGMAAAPYYLNSCDVANCAASLTISAAIQPGNPGLGCFSDADGYGIQVDGDFAYWMDTGNFQIRRAGITSGAAATEALPSGVSFEIDQGISYFSTSENTVFACDPSDCTATIRRFKMTPASGVDFYYSGVLLDRDADYLYFATSGPTDSDPVDLWSSFIRVRKDDSQPFELLCSAPGSIKGAQVQGDSLYWLEDSSSGRVLRCPKSGSSAEPEVVAEGFVNPAALAVDDKAVYVLERPRIAAGGHDEWTLEIPGRILSCPITGCSSPTVLYTDAESTGLQGMAIDEHFIYLAGSSCTRTPTLGDGVLPRCHHITAIPK